MIRKGDRYERVFGKFDGNTYAYKLCRIHSAECSVAFDVMDQNEESLDYERVREFWEEWVTGWFGRKEGWFGVLRNVREHLRMSRVKR
jgi:hypothetical protein